MEPLTIYDAATVQTKDGQAMKAGYYYSDAATR